MPFVESISLKYNTLIGLWRIDESYIQLKELVENVLVTEEIHQFEGFAHEDRKKQYLAVRLLLKHMLKGTYQKISYEPSGKPQLKSKYLSISHTHKYASIIISDKACGIDVESVREKITKISHRFLNTHEQLSLIKWQQEFLLSETELLSLIWSIKEAVFKMLGVEGLSFASQLTCLSFGKKSIKVQYTSNLNFTTNLKCWFTKKEDHYLVYVIE